jgi:hypothetical protein
MQSETFARDLYGRWDRFFVRSVERILDEELSAEKEDLIIDRLELDLGSLSEYEFDEQFPIRFREKLKETLTEYAGRSEGKESMTLFSWLTYFLLHGAFPWNAMQKDVNGLFAAVLKDNPTELKRFLLRYGHFTSLQERLVYQLNDPQLEMGVSLLHAGAGAFFVSYVKLLMA